VRLTFVRDGALRHAAMTTVDSFLSPGHPSIGATLGEAFRLPFLVTIDTQDIGGPSGGLVFALALADALTRADLTGGHRIAATGTIDGSGDVGEIGGVEEKVLAAERSAADVFVVPAGEAGAARRAAGHSLQVIGVRTLAEALKALRALPRR
jgi:PDZ domain-containing protein